MKHFQTYIAYNETAKGKEAPKGPKVNWAYVSYTPEQLKALSQEAYDYIMQVTEVLKTEPMYANVPLFKMSFIKKAQLNLSKEEADALVENFKKDTSIAIGDDQFNIAYIKEEPFSQILKDNVKLNNQYKELEAALTTWNTTNASASFVFDNKKSDAVSNADVSNKALNDLKDILTKYQAIVKNVRVTFIGHSSTIPVKDDPNGNVKLSQERAETVKNMFLNIYPDAKNFDIVSQGVGEKEPLFPDDKNDKEKQAKNRRVEVKITTDSEGGNLPEELVRYNAVLYGFTVVELQTDGKTTQHTIVKKKTHFQKLNSKGKIPCPKFMHQKK